MTADGCCPTGSRRNAHARNRQAGQGDGKASGAIGEPAAQRHSQTGSGRPDDCRWSSLAPLRLWQPRRRRERRTPPLATGQVEEICRRLDAASRASALPPKHGCGHPLSRPVEEILAARPAMNFGIADDAGETAGALALQLFPGRRVIHPATGAGELLECPYAIGHGTSIRARARS